MRRMMPSALVILVLVLSATAGQGDEAKPQDQGATDPKGVPLELKIVAGKDAYVPDLGGQTPEQFRQQLTEAQKSRRFPPAPKVDLVLDLRNTGDKEVRVKFAWPTPLSLVLQGPGAEARSLPGPLSGIPTPLFLPEFTLVSGKSHTTPLPALSYGSTGVNQTLHLFYWTQPGEYTLRASSRLAVSPAPQGARDAGGGFGYVTIRSAPVRFKVVEKK